jgi:hypothetical protein
MRLSQFPGLQDWLQFRRKSSAWFNTIVAIGRPYVKAEIHWA